MKTHSLLLNESPLPYRAVPFDAVAETDFIPAMKAAVARAKRKCAALCRNPQPPTFDNTLWALQQGEEALERIAEINGNLFALHSDDAFKKHSRRLTRLLARYSNRVFSDKRLFARIQQLYQALPPKESPHRAATPLLNEQYRITEKVYTDFVRKGALLPAAVKRKIGRIDESLSLLSLRFAQNALAATNAFSLLITDKRRLDGIPPVVLQLAADEAKKAGQSGWRLTLQPSVLIPVLTYCKDREIRKTLQTAHSRKALSGRFSNTAIINRIVALRHKRARYLGYETHARYVLEERMAKTPETVNAFLNELIEVTQPAAKAEIERLKAFAWETDGLPPDDFQIWDQSYYSQRFKQERFHYDPEAFRPYLKAESVVDGLFRVAHKLYGIEFEPISLPVYHPSVQTFRVTDPALRRTPTPSGAESADTPRPETDPASAAAWEATDDTLGLLYVDLYPRPTKQGGAWMSSFRTQSKNPTTGKRNVPLVVIAANLTPSTAESPSMLSLSDANTLFHEFGHALHALLSDVTYSTLASPNVLWDFVELPSQLMENWLTEKATLDLFARHFQTGEAVPQSLIDQAKADQTFMAATASLRQLSLAVLDMNYHHRTTAEKLPIADFEERSNRPFRLLPYTGGAVSPSFGHLFAGGYSAGYYSYKWAEVLDADAFEAFREAGIFSETVSRRFRTLLSKGNTVDPSELYLAFRGRAADPKALLRREGLLKTPQ